MNYYITVGHIDPDNYQDVGPYESEEAIKVILNALPEFEYYFNDDPDFMRDEWHADAIGGSQGCILKITTDPEGPVIPSKDLHKVIHWA